MQLSILNRKILGDIPSASGIEVLGDSVYVIGDDSPWLFRLNEKLEVADKFQIGDVASAVKGKIPKPVKPDLEALAVYKDSLLLFGSGSKSPQRDVLVQANITAPHIVKKYSLVELYESLCAAGDLTRNDLNIEGAVVTDEKLFLFNRGKNRIFKLNVKELLEHAENNGPVPKAEIFKATLPLINGIEAGFSGASITPDSKQIVFTASVENTPNWIDDGEILGSYVGIFFLSELNKSFSPACIALTDREKNILKIKVESVAVHHVVSSNTFRLLLVTDNDSSSSDILEAELKFGE